MSKVALFRDSRTVTPVGLRVPEDTKAKVAFIDSYLSSGKGLFVRSIAQHAARITRNHALYLPAKVEEGRGSMLSKARGGSAGYDKPVLVGHDDGSPSMFGTKGEGRILGRAVGNHYVAYDFTANKHTDRFGKSPFRLSDHKGRQGMGYWLDAVKDLKKTGLLYERDWEGLGHLIVDAMIYDQDAIEKILDQRWLTVSTGMSSNEAYCSECHTDFIKDGMCDHEPGSEGCFVIPGKLTYEEAFSYVVNPGDDTAQTVSFQIVNDNNKEVTNIMTESLREDFFTYPISLSFTDAYGSRKSMEDIKTDLPEKTEVELQDEAQEPEAAVELQDDVKEEPKEEVKLEDTLILTGASVENIISELSGHTINEITDQLVPAFSDKESLLAMYDAVVKAAAVKGHELTPKKEEVDLSGYVAQDEFTVLKTEADNLRKTLKDATDNKRFMRSELSEMFTTQKKLTEERDESISRIHDVLVEFTAILHMIDSKEGSFDVLKEAQSEKTISQLESEFNDLREKANFDNMVLRPDGTSGVVTNVAVDDPTLPGAGTSSEHSVKDATEKESKLYESQIQRYRWLEEYESKEHANNWLHRMKQVDVLPRDFDITKHLMGVTDGD